MKPAALLGFISLLASTSASTQYIDGERHLQSVDFVNLLLAQIAPLGEGCLISLEELGASVAASDTTSDITFDITASLIGENCTQILEEIDPSFELLSLENFEALNIAISDLTISFVSNEIGEEVPNDIIFPEGEDCTSSIDIFADLGNNILFPLPVDGVLCFLFPALVDDLKQLIDETFLDSFPERPSLNLDDIDGEIEKVTTLVLDELNVEGGTFEPANLLILQATIDTLLTSFENSPAISTITENVELIADSFVILQEQGVASGALAIFQALQVGVPAIYDTVTGSDFGEDVISPEQIALVLQQLAPLIAVGFANAPPELIIEAIFNIIEVFTELDDRELFELLVVGVFNEIASNDDLLVGLSEAINVVRIVFPNPALDIVGGVLSVLIVARDGEVSELILFVVDLVDFFLFDQQLDEEVREFIDIAIELVETIEARNTSADDLIPIAFDFFEFSFALDEFLSEFLEGTILDILDGASVGELLFENVLGFVLGGLVADNQISLEQLQEIFIAISIVREADNFFIGVIDAALSFSNNTSDDLGDLVLDLVFGFLEDVIFGGFGGFNETYYYEFYDNFTEYYYDYDFDIFDFFGVLTIGGFAEVVDSPFISALFSLYDPEASIFDLPDLVLATTVGELEAVFFNNSIVLGVLDIIEARLPPPFQAQFAFFPVSVLLEFTSLEMLPGNNDDFVLDLIVLVDSALFEIVDFVTGSLLLGGFVPFEGFVPSAVELFGIQIVNNTVILDNFVIEEFLLSFNVTSNFPFDFFPLFEVEVGEFLLSVNGFDITAEIFEGGVFGDYYDFNLTEYYFNETGDYYNFEVDPDVLATILFVQRFIQNAEDFGLISAVAADIEIVADIFNVSAADLGAVLGILGVLEASDNIFIGLFELFIAAQDFNLLDLFFGGDYYYYNPSDYDYYNFSDYYDLDFDFAQIFQLQFIAAVIDVPFFTSLVSIYEFNATIFELQDLVLQTRVIELQIAFANDTIVLGVLDIIQSEVPGFLQESFPFFTVESILGFTSLDLVPGANDDFEFDLIAFVDSTLFEIIDFVLGSLVFGELEPSFFELEFFNNASLIIGDAVVNDFIISFNRTDEFEIGFVLIDIDFPESKFFLTDFGNFNLAFNILGVVNPELSELLFRVITLLETGDVLGFVFDPFILFLLGFDSQFIFGVELFQTIAADAELFGIGPAIAFNINQIAFVFGVDVDTVENVLIAFDAIQSAGDPIELVFIVVDIVSNGTLTDIFAEFSEVLDVIENIISGDLFQDDYFYYNLTYDFPSNNSEYYYYDNFFGSLFSLFTIGGFAELIENEDVALLLSFFDPDISIFELPGLIVETDIIFLVGVLTGNLDLLQTFGGLLGNIDTFVEALVSNQTFDIFLDSEILRPVLEDIGIELDNVEFFFEASLAIDLLPSEQEDINAIILPGLSISAVDMNLVVFVFGLPIIIDSNLFAVAQQAVLLFVDYTSLGLFDFGTVEVLPDLATVGGDFITCGLGTVAASLKAQSVIAEFDVAAFIPPPPQDPTGVAFFSTVIGELLRLYSPALPTIIETLPRDLIADLPNFFLLEPTGVQVCLDNALDLGSDTDDSGDNNNGDNNDDGEAPVAVIVPAAIGGLCLAGVAAYIAFAGGAVVAAPIVANAAQGDQETVDEDEAKQKMVAKEADGTPPAAAEGSPTDEAEAKAAAEEV